MIETRTQATTTHGRYLVDTPAVGRPELLIVGFHGYAEQASIQLERLQAVRQDRAVVLVSIQALHRFYRNVDQAIVANWMTREDRELSIADNVAYVDAIVARVVHETSAASVVFAGFSQGASMAYRAAVLGRHQPAGVIAMGGDVPPELDVTLLARAPRVLVGWAERDTFYTAAKRDADLARLRAAGCRVDIASLDAGHKWTPEFNRACAEWLGQLP